MKKLKVIFDTILWTCLDIAAILAGCMMVVAIIMVIKRLAVG